MTDGQFVMLYFMFIPMILLFITEGISEYFENIKKIKLENIKYRKQNRLLQEEIERENFIKNELPNAVGNSARIYVNSTKLL